MPQATRAAAELKQALQVDVKLVEGTRGIFDVRVNGKTVYSKGQTHRFPEPGELQGLLPAT